MRMPFKNIFSRYKSKNVTPFEENVIESWLLDYDSKATISEEDLNQRMEKLDRHMDSILYPKRRLYAPFIRAAAAVLIVTSATFLGYFYFKGDQTITKNVAAPKGLHSTIKLAGDQIVSLSDIHTGDTLQGKGYAITKLASGELKYLQASSDADNVTNTIYTKPGDLTTVILSDGTKVFINANSELTYPITLKAAYRSVYLKGEAYFEVVSAAKLAGAPPFYVISEHNTVMVTGTKFNVNTYKNTYAATLFEGKIGMADAYFPLHQKPVVTDPVWLNPNHQYKQLNGKHAVVFVKNIEAVLDWKNGIFDFNELTLTEVCDKISNWYGVAFSIDKGLANRKYYGQISKTKNLSQVLNLLTLVNDLQFEVADNAIYVSAK